MTWGMIGAAAISVVGGALLGGSSGGGGGGGGSQVYDPYGPYRNAAALQLNTLMSDPSSIQNLPEYKAAMLGASRQSASQGYNGSGNALVAAANAGGTAYQQAFNNLALLSGAGQSPASAAQAANQQADYQQQANNQMWGQIGGIAGRLINNFSGSSNPNYTPGTQVGSLGGYGGGGGDVAIGDSSFAMGGY